MEKEEITYQELMQLIKASHEEIKASIEKSDKAWEKSQQEWQELRAQFKVNQEAEKQRRVEEDKRRAEEAAAEKQRRVEEAKHRAEEAAAEKQRRAEEDKRRAEEAAAEKQRRAEEDKRRAEMDARIEAANKKSDKVLGQFTSMWGKLVESLVEGDLVRILTERGIPVFDTSRRRKGLRNSIRYEFDIIAHNGPMLVIIEVKTTLRPDDVKHFAEKMSTIKELIPEFADKTIYGAMAYLEADGDSEIMAEKRGFFCIKATGDSASIINPIGFKAKAWGND